MRPHPPTETARIVETLQGLMDRLSAPDLTAAEARDLRERLFRLLEAIETEKHRKNAAGAPSPACGPSGCLVG